MLPVWLILAIAVPVVLVIALLGCLDCLKYKKRFQHFKDEEDGNRVESRTNAGYFPETDSSDQSGVSSTEVQIEPLPDILVQTTTRKPRIGCVEKSKQDAAFKLITSHRSFPRRQLTYLKEIGSGWFGQIIESDAEMIILGVARSRVVVKILKDECTKSEQKIFHEDIAPFRELEHGNVLRMLGQCTETTPVLAIFEFAQMGDLKTYLKKQKLEDNKLPYHQFLKFAIDAASGMACLHRHGYVHHDFAARSCLVFSDLIVKVGDYGITEEQFPDDYYISHQEMLPVRWMAPESLSHQADIWQTAVITKEANIWCFGILLWEVLSYAAQPYTDLTDDMVLQLVVEDKVVKLCKPDLDILFLDRLYEVMQFCWLNPGQRPTIVEVHALLEHIFTKITTPQTMDSDFETRWNSIIPSEARVITVSDSRPKTRKSNSFDSDFVPLTDTAVKLPRKSVQTTSIENISIIKTPDAVSEIKDNNQLSDVINARDKMSGDAPLSEFSNSAQLGKQLPSHLTSTPVDKQTQQTLKPNLVQKDSNASSKYKSLNFNDSESVLNHLSYNTEIYPDTMESGKFVTASSSIVTVESTDTAESDYLDFGELVNADNLGEATVVKENEDTILLNNCQQIGSPSAFSMRSRSSGEESFVSVPESPTVGSLPESEQHSSDVLASTDDQTEDSKETVAEDTTASEISKTESLIDDNINNDEELVKNELAEKDFPEDNDEFGEFVSVPVEDPHLVTLAKPSEEENISKVAPETNNENEFNSLNKSAPLAAMDISEDEPTAKGMILSPDEKVGTCVEFVNNDNDDENNISSSDSEDDSSSDSGKSYICDNNDLDSEIANGELCVSNNAFCDNNSSGAVDENADDQDEDHQEEHGDKDLELVSEMYLSKGVVSPQAFERSLLPLETIPEDAQTVSDTSSMETKFDDVFSSQDNFEWDDFMGEELVGKDKLGESLAKASLEISDWRLDSASFHSNTSLGNSSDDVIKNKGLEKENTADIVESVQSENEVKNHRFQTQHPRIANLSINRYSVPSYSHVSADSNQFYSLLESLDLENESPPKDSNDGLSRQSADSIFSTVTPIVVAKSLSSSDVASFSHVHDSETDV